MPTVERPSKLLSTATLLILATGATLLVGIPTQIPSALAVPQPDAVPRRWELQLTPGPLQVASVEVPGHAPAAYLFITYKVVNKSGADRLFAPSFDLDLGDGKVYRSGRDVPSEVVDTLIKRSANPELVDEIHIQGMLLQGDENAKEGIVVWPCPNLKPEFVKVFMAGFSGETKSITRPDNNQTAVLRKQRMLSHQISGEIDPTRREPLARTEDLWIMR
ncbi:MAG TPA: hypothetical protein VG797_02580 [Phycisphaerales bacterium]|nr:hypothetical protein [Phycisphaerales bacterium]